MREQRALADPGLLAQRRRHRKIGRTSGPRFACTGPCVENNRGCRRATWERIGPLDIDLQAGFVEWLTRANHLGLRQHMLDAVIALRRIHDSNLTIRARAAVQADYFRVLKASLDRRRNAE